MSQIKVDIANCIRVQTSEIRLVTTDFFAVDLDEDVKARIDQACAMLEWLVECLDGLPPVGNDDLQAIEALLKERAA